MPGPLQLEVRLVRRGEDGIVGMDFIRPEQRPGARHRDRMVVAGAAFGGDQIIPAVALVDVRPFREPELRSPENVADRPHEALLDRIILLQRDSAELVSALAVIPDHVDQPLAAVVIMEQRRVEAAAVQVNRLGPRTFDARRGHEIVVGVLERADVAFHVGEHEIEQTVRVAEAGRPDAAGIGVAEHVELAPAVERPGDEAPVAQVAGMVNLHAGEPLERRGRDVVVVPHPEDGRVRVEASQHGIADRLHGDQPPCRYGTRTSGVQRDRAFRNRTGTGRPSAADPDRRDHSPDRRRRPPGPNGGKFTIYNLPVPSVL